MQSARAVILPLVACLALPYFYTLSQKRYDFRIKVSKHQMCVFIFSETFIRNFSHSKKNIIKNVKVKVKQSSYRPGVAQRVPGS